MDVIVANSIGRLRNGRYIMLFPSRCNSAMNDNTYHWYPYELAYLTSVLKQQEPSWKVRLIDGNLRGWNGWEYGTYLSILRPDVLVTECAALDYAEMTLAMQAVREVQPDLYAVLCGPFGQAYPDRALGDGWDAVIVGEFEEVVPDAIRGRPKGVIRAPRLVDIAALPYPEDGDICRTDYADFCALAHPTLQMFPTRGCPLSCSYCVAPTYYGGHGKSYHSYRTRPVEQVVEEMRYLAAKYQCRSFLFNDETSNADREWTLRLCEAIAQSGINPTIDAMGGYWTMDAEMVRAMQRAGYKQFRVGIESFDQQTGATLGKRIHIDKFMHMLEELHKADIMVFGYCQVEAPGSTPQGDRETLKVLRELIDRRWIARVQAAIGTPQPGTPYHAEAVAKGWIAQPDLDKYDWFHVIVDRPDYPASEAEKVLAEYKEVCSLRLRP